MTIELSATKTSRGGGGDGSCQKEKIGVEKVAAVFQHDLPCRLPSNVLLPDRR